MTRSYGYPDDVRRQVAHMIKQALATVAPSLRIADRTEDFGGIDLHYIANDVPIQARCRFDRPHDAHTRDVTFRTTEPPMIDAGTYAPLAIFVWFWNGTAKAGQLVDPYRAHSQLDLRAYGPVGNGDGTRFHPVPMSDLLNAGAWLRTGDDHNWTTVCTGGLAHVERILRSGWSPGDRAVS